MDTWAIVIGSVIVIFASSIQALTGFGFALVLVPIMLMFSDPQFLVPIIPICGVLISITVLIKTKKYLNLKALLPLILAGVAGIYPGAYLLKVVDSNSLKAFIGGIVFVTAIALLLGFKKTFHHEKIASIPIGFSSGLLCGSIAIPGPPVVLFFTIRDMERDVFRANILFYFLVLYVISILTFKFQDIITSQILTTAVIFMPSSIIGSLIGIRLASKVPEKTFKKLVLTLMVIAGVVLIAKSII